MRLEGIEPSSQVWKTWVMAVIRQPLNIHMNKLKEGNLYNVETSEIKQDRSEELNDVNKIMMDQFWDSMVRQGISPEVAKQIAKQTFKQN
jgi:hypothetical protein